MGKFEDTSSEKTTPDLLTEMMMDEKDGEEFTLGYLKARFLSSIGSSLYYARRNAGLTQAQVAERMNTKQSVIARFEAGENGSMSFRRYLDFAIACGMMPRSFRLHPILEPIATLREEMLTLAKSRQVKKPLYDRYSSDVQESLTLDIFTKVQYLRNPVPQATRQLLIDRDKQLAVETANGLVKESQRSFLAVSSTTASSDLHTSTVAQLSDNKGKVGVASNA